MKKIIRLTESDLINLVKRVLKEREGDDTPKIPPFKMEIYEKAFDWVLEQLKNENFGAYAGGPVEGLGKKEELKSGFFPEFLNGFAYEMTMWVLGNYPRAMEGGYFHTPDSMAELMWNNMFDRDAEDPFYLTYDIIIRVFRDRIREVFDGRMGISEPKPSKIQIIAKEIMSSPRVREIEVNMDPSEYEDEFEYADNFFYNLLSDYEDEYYYDDLMEYVKDEFSEMIFSFYFNS